MSVDQNLLYRSCRAIMDGFCPPSLQFRALGKVSHARWLTLAIRINFLYMSCINPSEEIVHLATFVVTIYSYLWFSSKLKWRATDAPLLVFKAMKLLNSLPKDEQRIVFPTFQHGFFWAHSKQLLLGCLGSENGDVRAQAVARILHLRHTEATEPSTSRGKGKRVKSIRILKMPMPIYSATHFSKMIDWTTEQICEPPYLRKFTDEEIRRFEQSPLILNVPSNSQHVERFIQLITKNGLRAASPTLRDGLCKATIQSRQLRPKVETKADFSNKK